MQLWEDFLKVQEERIGKNTVEKWLRPLKVARFDAGNLYLEANDSFQSMWFEEHIKAKAQNELFKNSKKIKVHITVRSQIPQNSIRNTQAHKVKDASHFSINYDSSDELLNIDNFIPTENNLLAHELFSRIGDCFPSEEGATPILDVKSFNPIFLHGNSGSGRSHLLMAANNILKSLGLEVLYVKAETFTNNVVRAIRAAEMKKFRQLYRHVDVLIVDDIQILSGKSSTQEEFFHTFNALHLTNKLIILSANCAPSELKNIEPRLVSRFEWGISLALEPLERKSFQELLDIKSKAYDFTIESKLQSFLLAGFSRNTNSFTKAIESLALRAQLEPDLAPEKIISFEKAAPFLQKMLDEEKLASITPQKIIKAVADYYETNPEDLLSKAQKRDISNPRKLAMYICRNRLELPYAKIGAIFSRDHSTVIANIRQIKKKLEEHDNEVQLALKHIINNLY